MTTADKDFLFTSESVSEGHPDKVCDRISDEIVDMFLRRDPYARLAIETLATTNRVVLAGEIRVQGGFTRQDMTEAARRAVRDIGYEQKGFHWRNMEVDCYVHEQSPHIAQGVDANAESGKDEGAGDQGIMFGYACRETEELMPAPIAYSHGVLRRLSEYWRSNPGVGLGPDAKSQITLQYQNGRPVRAASVVVSIQHAAGMTQQQVRELVRPHVEAVLPTGWMPPEDEFYVNPTGVFEIGGPDGDAGLTGRKIIVDTYGGAAPHGGGAFSGKDPTKVDRSAAYAARYLAKNLVAADFAERCVIQLSYAIGVSKPLSVYVDFRGTGRVPEAKVAAALRQVMDLSPRGIREHLRLNAPIYAPTSCYGHFGRQPRADGAFSWERTDLGEALKAALS